MINKYQQGGAAPQLGGGILALIQQLPQEQQQQLMQAFAQWAQQKGVDIQQLQSNPAALEQALGQFMQEMQAQQAQAAKHGAKLRFIKGLKHQCEADEHLEYFAKGGAIGCNCVKNKQGGKAEPKVNALEQFKAKKGINLKKDKCGGKMKKHLIGGTIETLRQSLGLEKKNLTKYQVGGTISPIQASTLQSPTQTNNLILGGNRTYNALISIFKHMIPGFTEAVNMKNEQLKDQMGYEEAQKAKYRVRVPFLKPDVKSLQPVRFEASNRKPSYQEGGEFGGSNKSNRFAPQPVRSIPETTVNGIDRRWRYDSRQQDHGNGYGVKSQTFFDYYDGGNTYLGDLAPIRGGRTIYMSPQGNDTLYWNQPSKWIWYQHGLMPVGGNQPGAKANFFKNLKRPLINQ